VARVRAGEGQGRAARSPASGQAAIAPPEAPAEWEGEEQTTIAAEHGHIDKRV
jgi:hypothetical protein